MGRIMKNTKTKIAYLSICLFFFFTILSNHLIAEQTDNILEFKTSPNIKYQTIDGFGASDAWRVQFVGKNWPVEKRKQIADWLFSQELDKDGNPKGIGLSIWRVYLSAGSTEQGKASGIKNPWRRGECFLNIDGTYDWNKQAGQQWFMQAAKDHGVEKLLAFSIAAPVQFSINNKAYAPKNSTKMNIKPDHLDDYAKYLVDVIEHFNKTKTPFDYLSPINETQWNWDEAGQEGTPALNKEVHSFVKYLSKDLSERNLKTKIVITEAATIGHVAMQMQAKGTKNDGRDDQANFFFNKKSPTYIGDLPNVEKTISAHSYFSVWPLNKQVQQRIKVNNLIKKANPDLGYWMTEYCILQQNDEIIRGGRRDLTMKTALYVARIIHNDLTLTNAKSWQWWTALSQCDFKDGLVYLDDGSTKNGGKMGHYIESLHNDGTARDSKLLWVLGNYSRFIRPGMIRIESSISQEQSIQDGLLASAYTNPKDNSMVYVFTNLSEQTKNIKAGKNKLVKTYTTDKDNNLKLSPKSLDNLKIPPRSVVTVISNE